MTVVSKPSFAGVEITEVERVAEWASSLGPHRLREEMRAEARLRVLEALQAGNRLGMGRAAYRGAMEALRSANFQAGQWQSRSAFENGLAEVSIGGSNEDRTVRRALWTSPEMVPQGKNLGPLLDRLSDLLVSRGLDRGAVVEALSVLIDGVGNSRPPATRSPSGPRPQVFNVSAASMAVASGLSERQCRALKVLVLGERSRADRNRKARPGLIERAHRGDKVWVDRRVRVLVNEVVAPSRRITNAWASRPCRTGAAPGRVLS